MRGEYVPPRHPFDFVYAAVVLGIILHRYAWMATQRKDEHRKGPQAVVVVEDSVEGLDSFRRWFDG